MIKLHRANNIQFCTTTTTTTMTTTGLRIRLFTLLVKLLTCLLYVGRVIFDSDPTQAAWYVTRSPLLVKL